MAIASAAERYDSVRNLLSRLNDDRPRVVGAAKARIRTRLRDQREDFLDEFYAMSATEENALRLLVEKYGLGTI